MASMNRIQGITIEVNGDTTKLTESLKAVDSQLKNTQSTLKDVEKLLKLDPGNVDLLRQKQQALGDAIKATSDRLKQLKDAQSQFNKGTSEWDALQREIIETESNLESLEKEYRNFGSVAAQQVAAVGQEMKDMGSKLTDIGKNLTTKVTVPIVAGFTAAAKSASDYEENLNKLSVAFGQSAKQVQEFTDNAMAAYGLSKVAASDAASAFGALAKGVGLADTQAAEMAITLTGLTSDLASYFNTGTDVSATALEAIFTGQTQALKKFGVVMTETNLTKFASDHKKVYKALSDTEKVMLRYQYVLESTKDAQGDYSRTSDGMANSAKTFTAAIQDLGTSIGTVLLPIITPVINKLTEIINKIANLPEPIRNVIVTIGLIVAAIGPLLLIGGKLLTGIGSFLTFAPKAIAAIGGIGSAVGAASSTVGVACLATVGHIALIVAAFAAAVVAGWALAKAISEHWDEIVDAVKKGVKAVSDFLTGMWNGFTGTFKKIGSTVMSGVNTIRNTLTTGFQNAKNAVMTAWNAMTTGISSGINQMRNAISNGFGSIASSVASVFQRMYDNARNIFQNLINMVGELISRVRNMFSSANWSLPKIKLPHFKVNWKDIGGIIKLPLVSVEWYRKAYENPYLFTSPTVVGGRGFGDGNGGEIVYGHDQLMRDIAAASTGNITVNVYGTEGMNVNQLADKVQQRLAQLQKQRMNAYA